MSVLREPLLQVNHKDELAEDQKVTRYANAGLLSKLSFRWLNNLLGEGICRTIVSDDIPILAPQHRAAKVYELFVKNWPKQPEPHSVRHTLLKTFWRPLLQTAMLAACRLSVLFIGPFLIQHFVVVASGIESFAYERYTLVVLLVFAKTVEAISSHQYNFACAKLGMQIKSALMTTIYRKGLRLSSLSRQSHGLGPITNHMSVDVQALSQLMIQVNNVWIIPVQVVLGGAVMYPALGLSSIAGLVVMAVVAWLSYQNAKLLQVSLQKWAEGRDLRMNAMVKVLSSIKVIKLQAWDGKFLAAVEKERKPEFSAIKKFTYLVAWAIFFIGFSPLATSVAIFSCSILLGQELTASMAFTIIATVRILQDLLRLFPNTMLSFSNALISLERLERYLWSDELQQDAVIKLPPGQDTAISVEAGTFKWDAESETPTLEDINLNIRQGSLVAVVGRVGAGKSSLLAALQGEIPKVAGTVTTSGTTACVTQSPWIQNATIEACILFGMPMEKARYERACEACALQPDLVQLEAGDQTEIGEHGINLSGGQKQRIQLARALYQDSDIYYLDDVFSAVDAHTGSHLFRECVLGALHGKTVILVTHQVDFLSRADMILVMKDGRIVQSGKYYDLLVEGTHFEALVDAHSGAMGAVGDHQERGSASQKVLGQYLRVRASNKRPEMEQLGDGVNGSDPPPEQKSKEDEMKLHREDNAGRLVKEEQREAGRVSFGVYWMYLTRAYGGLLLIPVLIIQATWQIALVAGDYWVANEASFAAEDRSQAKRFIFVYTGVAFCCALLVLMQSFLVGFFGLATTQNLFQGMLHCIFRAPMSFFDTTPIGRILSRATTDQANTDYLVPMLASTLLSITLQVLGILVVASQVVWQVSIVAVPMAFIFIRYQAYYLETSRELTRLDGITKAPIISHFSETVSGFAIIRCSRQQNRFIEVNEAHVDTNLKMDFHNNAAAEWVGYRIELIAVILLCAATILIMFSSSSFESPNLVGLALTYALSLNQTLYSMVLISCQLENKMVSVERIWQYTKLPSEAPLRREDNRPPSSWPGVGTIVLQDLTLRYRAHTPLVLKGISVILEGGQKVGVVGRTGSGKSTLVLALFRLVEPSSGRIIIDDVDIRTIGLADLRSRLSIIPQDPILFDGTVRSNLDVLEDYSDADIWEALEKCQLASNVRQMEGKLDAPVLANGENWSLGQRQLFCVARVLLKRTRILVLDEATSSVDSETDTVIRKIVQGEFSGCTVISIAHRIPSVLDSDKALVLDAGMVREFDSPSSLLSQPHSMFSSLVREYATRGSG